MKTLLTAWIVLVVCWWHWPQQLPHLLASLALFAALARWVWSWRRDS